MKYNQPYGVTDPNAPYINGNPSTGTMGSIPPAASIEMPQREIANLITGTGMVATNADTHQLAKAIQSGRLFYGLDSGSANHMSTALVPTPDALTRGMFVFIEVAANNTGATDLTTNGVTAGVARQDGSALILGDLLAGHFALLVFDGLRWQLIGPAGGGGSSNLRILTQPLDLYVNGVIGNDANDGISNTPEHAFKTVQHGVDVAQSYMPSQYGVNIHVADSVYDEAVLTSGLTTPTINIIGNVANPDAVLIGRSGQCVWPKFGGLGVQGANTMNVEGVCARSGTYPTDNPPGFIAWFGGVMNVKNTSSAFCQGGVFEAFGGATINFLGNHKFGPTNSSASGAGFLAFQAGTIYATAALPIVFTYMGGINWLYTAACYDCATVMFQQHHALHTGTAPNAYRFGAYLNGVVDTEGGGANYLPGIYAGIQNSGGQYG